MSQGQDEANERTALLANENDRRANNGAAEYEAGSSGEGQEDQDQSLAVEEEWTTARLAVMLGSCYLAVFFAAMDSTIVATLSAPISSSFNSFTLLSWLASAYLIANAGFQPISGKLSDIYGRRPCLVAACITFAIGNLICGLARAEWVMVFGRVVAGIGGGCINTVGVFVASDLVPLKRRGVWQGFGNIAFGVGSGVGGVFGGWMNDVLDWRWAFLIQIPFVALSTVVIFFTVKIPTKKSDKSRISRVDFLGAATLVTALVLLLLGLNSGGNIVPWNHPLVYVSIPVAGVLLIVFVYIEDKIASEPVIPVRLLLDRTVAAGCFVNWSMSMAFFMYMYYGPIYFQVKGLSATQAGERLIPNAIGLGVGSLGSGYIMRRTGKYYWLNVVVQVMFVVATALILAFFNLYTPSWPPFLILLLGGLAYGSVLTISLIALISAVPHEFQAVITSASYAARSTGSTIGIAIASAIFQNILTSRLWNVFRDEKNAAETVKRLRDSIGTIKELHDPLKTEVLIAYMDALQGVWGTMFAIAVFGAFAGLLMRENTLYSTLARK